MEHNKTNKRWLTLIVISVQILIIILSMAVGYFGQIYYQQRQGEFNLLRQAKDILLRNAIVEIPPEQQLEHGMIQGMLATLNDPYTFFVAPAAHEIQSNELTGQFGGIGARLERDTQMNWRLYPIPDSSASQAGIRDGDVLIKVDDLEIDSQTDEVTLLAALRGSVGEKVSMTIMRGEDKQAYTIERQAIDIPSVSYNLLPEDNRIGLIQLNRIAESSPNEIDQAITTLQKQGASGLILDLRDNVGGLVEAGVEIARMFLTHGDAINRQYRDQKDQVFKVEKPGLHSEIPMVVLVNRNTASAAEIVAGSLKSHQRATLIGMPTFGKTQIQFIFDLQDGSSIHVTSGKWWIPDQSFPLHPDIEVGDTASEAEILQIALQAITSLLD